MVKKVKLELQKYLSTIESLHGITGSHVSQVRISHWVSAGDMVAWSAGKRRTQISLNNSFRSR